MRKNRIDMRLFLAFILAFICPAIAEPVAVPTEGVVQPPAHETTAAAPPPASQADEVVQDEEKNFSKSLFFTPQQIESIHTAIGGFLARGGKQGDTMLATDTTKPNSDQSAAVSQASQSHTYTYPQFFLESLIYHSPKDWVVRINGLKITQDTPADSSELQVIAIDHDKAAFKWRPADMKRVEQAWAEHSNKQTDFDNLAGTVAFTLHANQTFSSYVMKVLEGKVTPVTVDMQAASSTSVSSGEDAVSDRCGKQIAAQAPNADATQKQLLINGCVEMEKKVGNVSSMCEAEITKQAPDMAGEQKQKLIDDCTRMAQKAATKATGKMGKMMDSLASGGAGEPPVPENEGFTGLLNSYKQLKDPQAKKYDHNSGD